MPCAPRSRELRRVQVAQNARLDVLTGELRDESRINREVLRRNEIAFMEGRRAVSRSVARLEASSRAIVTELGEVSDESPAQREALFRLIHELRGDGAEPGPGS